MVGRNDPCPCGSGQKFKRCCLPKQQLSRRTFTPEDRDRALSAVMRFSARSQFEAEHEEAEAEFWDHALDELADDDVERALDLEQSQMVYHTWFAFDRPLEDGRLLVDGFLNREAHTIAPGAREFLARMRATHLAPYEITRVEPDRGLEVRNLWTGDVMSVSVRLGTHQLATWDVLAARVMAVGGGEQTFEGALLLYQPMVADRLLATLHAAHDVFATHVPGGSVTSFLKEAGPLFHEVWLTDVAFPPRPTIVTAEGDQVTLGRLTFAIHDRDALDSALARHPDLDRQGDGRSYLWSEAIEDGGRRGLATLIVKRDRLVVEVTSRPRAARARAFVEQLAGDAVRFRRARYESVDAALERHRRSPQPPRGTSIPPDVQAEIVAAFHEKHYREWVDHPLPALDGRSPRDAVADAALRPTVIALVKQMENRADRDRRAGKSAYDFGWMWAALGIERK